MRSQRGLVAHDSQGHTPIVGSGVALGFVVDGGVLTGELDGVETGVVLWDDIPAVIQLE
jgi:hypothetical protein